MGGRRRALGFEVVAEAVDALRGETPPHGHHPPPLHCRRAPNVEWSIGSVRVDVIMVVIIIIGV